MPGSAVRPPDRVVGHDRRGREVWERWIEYVPDPGDEPSARPWIPRYEVETVRGTCFVHPRDSRAHYVVAVEGPAFLARVPGPWPEADTARARGVVEMETMLREAGWEPGEWHDEGLTTFQEVSGRPGAFACLRYSVDTGVEWFPRLLAEVS